jgi:hypothetical protein
MLIANRNQNNWDRTPRRQEVEILAGAGRLQDFGSIDDVVIVDLKLK